MRKQVARAMLTTAVVTLLASLASAGDCRCAHCGCDECQKVCRLVKEEKKVEVTCWGCKCEDFCIPGPSKKCDTHCKMVCVDCEQEPEKDAPCTVAKKFLWTDWIPGCAHIHTKKKLMKKVITEKVPSHKWVVEDLCEKCQMNCQRPEVRVTDDVPPPPAVAARLIPGIAVADPIPPEPKE